MKKSPSPERQMEKQTDSLASLRRKAEEKLRTQLERLQKLSARDIRELVHELRTHQIELEMQNEELRKSRDELETSRNQYSELYDFAPVGYCTLDVHGLIEEINLTGAHMLGIERGLLLKRPFINFIAEAADREIFSQHRKEVFQKQGNQTCEIRLKRKDSTAFYAQLQSVAAENLDGKAGHIRTTIIDVADHRKADEAIKFQADALSQVNDAVVAVDNGYRVTYWNKAAERQYNLKSADVIGRPLKDAYSYTWIHADDERAAQQSLKSTGTWHGETLHVKKNGEEIYVLASVSVLKDASGAPIGRLAVMRDITERKKAEEKIEHLASFPRLNPNPVIETDLNEQVIYSNAAATGILKKLNVPEDVRLFLPRDLNEMIKTLEQGNDEQHFSREVEINGEVFAETLFLSAKLKSVRIYAQDITKRKRAEEALQKAYAELDMRVKERTQELVRVNELLSQEIEERKGTEGSLRSAYAENKELKDRFQAENIYLHNVLEKESNFGDIIGKSHALEYVFFRVEQVAPQDATVLLLGETGTGKGIIARAIHSRSSRKDRPMITVNCSALPANLIESELFGREKGAFTGSHDRQMGRFELADNSTLFLDEIGEMPMDLQTKLLRVLQDGEFERLGSPRTIKVNVRIIASTNRNLEEEIRKGRFREDLFYRLNVFPITIPPLRQRKEDIPLLVDYFVAKFNKKTGKRIETVSKDTLNVLQEYDWPGNVRELESIVERAVITSQGTGLQILDRFENSLPAGGQGALDGKCLAELERDHILQALEKTGWRVEGKQGAAAMLGLNPSTLRGRMRKDGISRTNIIHSGKSIRTQIKSDTFS
jgi:formate hydrogenlyase transcriptional activator